MKVTEPAPSHLFNSGDFTLHSGGATTFKIDCEALTLADWKALAALIRERIGRYRSVYGIPRGGVPLEELLAPDSTGDWRDPVLIVDDVYTTGTSMREAHSWIPDTENIVGAVVFARQPVREPWITALFIMVDTND
jgi:orotate phosphoribosyltransferase